MCNATYCPLYPAGSAVGIYVDGPSLINGVNISDISAGNAVTGANCSAVSTSIYGTAYGIQGGVGCTIENCVVSLVNGGSGGDCCASGGLAFGIALESSGYLYNNNISQVIGGKGGICFNYSTNVGGAAYGFKFQSNSTYFAGNQVYSIEGGVAGAGPISGQVSGHSSLEVDVPFFQCSYTSGGPVCEPSVSSCCVDQCVIVANTSVICLDSNSCDVVYCDGVDDYCPPVNKTMDGCGVCGGNNSTCASGCDHQPYSNKTYDACGVCGGNNSTCSSGCDHQPYSNLTNDACGVCGGNNSTCLSGCDHQPNSNKTYDACGVCGGTSACVSGCDHQPYSNKTYDACGVCGGNNSTCASGCDHQPNSNKTYDACGVCGGNGTTCLTTTAGATSATSASSISSTTNGISSTSATSSLAPTNSATVAGSSTASTTKSTTSTSTSSTKTDTSSTTQGKLNLGETLQPNCFLILALLAAFCCF